MCDLCNKTYGRLYNAPLLQTKSNNMPYANLTMSILNLKTTTVSFANENGDYQEPIPLKFCPLCGKKL